MIQDFWSISVSILHTSDTHGSEQIKHVEAFFFSSIFDTNVKSNPNPESIFEWFFGIQLSWSA